MLRSILAVIAGFVLWSILWVGFDTVLHLAMPDAFNADGTTDSNGLLLSYFLVSMVISILSGYLTAFIPGKNFSKHAYGLGILLLVVGLGVQISTWSLMPVWYHLSFLAFLVPCVLMGAGFRARQLSLTFSD